MQIEDDSIRHAFERCGWSENRESNTQDLAGIYERYGLIFPDTLKLILESFNGLCVTWRNDSLTLGEGIFNDVFGAEGKLFFLRECDIVSYFLNSKVAPFAEVCMDDFSCQVSCCYAYINELGVIALYTDSGIFCFSDYNDFFYKIAACEDGKLLASEQAIRQKFPAN